MKKRVLVAMLGLSLAFAGGALAFAGCSREKASLEYGEWETVVSPTCEASGLEKRICLTNAELTQTRAVPALGHDWNEWEQTTAPTCVTNGVKQRSCNTCNNFDYAAVPALGHEWGEWQTVLEATCLADGYEKSVCLHDQAHTQTRAIEALGHDWSEWTVVNIPTCEKTGAERRRCRNDNAHTQARTVEALGHDWNEPVVVKAPACEEAGEQRKICKNDGSHYESTQIAPIGHVWGEWIVEREPTESKRGQTTRYCENDAAHTEQVFPWALGSDCLNYTLNEEGTAYSVCVIAAKKPEVTVVYIPTQHQGLPVTEVAQNGFMSCLSLEKVVFLNNQGNMKTVGDHAFANCRSLKYIVLPDTVTKIGSRAFYLCTTEAFRIPKNVTSIGENAFGGWQDTQELFLEGVESEEQALLRWGSSWNLQCNAKITYDGGQDEYADDLTFSFYDNGSAYHVRARNKNVTAVTIPAYYRGVPVTSIADNGFANCAELASITVQGNNLQKIGGNAFVYCQKLNEFSIPQSVITVGQNAFARCYGFTRLEISVSVTHLGASAFRDLTGEQTVVIKGFASQEEADAVWGSSWRNNTLAQIVYEG